MIRKFFIFYIILQVQFSYANEFEKGMFALEMEDYERAVYYLSFEAVQGNPRAQYNWGLCIKTVLALRKISMRRLDGLFWAQITIICCQNMPWD